MRADRSLDAIRGNLSHNCCKEDGLLLSVARCDEQLIADCCHRSPVPICLAQCEICGCVTGDFLALTEIYKVDINCRVHDQGATLSTSLPRCWRSYRAWTSFLTCHKSTELISHSNMAVICLSRLLLRRQSSPDCFVWSLWVMLRPLCCLSLGGIDLRLDLDAQASKNVYFTWKCSCA